MRRNLIRLVHTGKTRLGWDDETYRDVLARQTGKRSAGDCSDTELEKMVLYMRTQGFAPSSHGRRPRVATGRRAMLGKIEALLAEAGRPWAYLGWHGLSYAGREKAR
ncbi:Mu-like prophage protein gp16 [Cedecea neteri]|uniref:Mu-like prophage protein gp16 n=1 Tax=Cedecea neteri TaxID=158822 RepID=A0A2X3JF40_9ENTR|nr:Mu-like prophage protein gp16 [Cedecea neteri]